MKLAHYIISSLIFLAPFTLSFAQEVEFNKSNFNNSDAFKEAMKEIKQGDALYFRFRYEEALQHYMKAQNFNPKSSELNAKIGNCYLNSADKAKATPYLEEALKLKNDLDGFYVFLLAKAYHLENRFDEAIKTYKDAEQRGSKVNPTGIDDVPKRIKECENGKKLIGSPVNVTLENLGSAINTSAEEYVPVINADESVMFFTSRRISTTGGQIDPQIGDYYEDIYYSEKEDGEWSQAINLGNPVNTDRHDATVGLSIDGQKLLIYRDDSKGRGNIMISEQKGKTWSDPVALPSPINSKNRETSACFSYDGKKIYFVSDRPGGEGGKDIYVSELQDDGKWGEAKNLGNAVNTPYDEDAVFLHPDGKTLYFSSKGHNSMGGYDIFKTTLQNGKWTKPVNLGYPINTSDDDVCIVLTASGEYGYYTSIRPEGFGKRDIYRISFLDEIERIKNQPKLTLLKGIIYDSKTKAPIEATIEVFDNDSNKVVATFSSNSETGKYMISLPSGRNYGINVDAKGYIFHSENVNLPEYAGFEEKVNDIGLQKIEVGAKVVLKNIFYDYGKASLRSDSYNELDKLVKLITQNPKLRVEISSHTDSRGSAAYNKDLSEKRAQSCIDYLVSKGISRDRLIAKGYGKEQPVIFDDEIALFDSEDLREQAHQLNRRTEFKIIGN
jgi:outer membrane protein OmpA-like peptidoglycan-associated protein/tetratricopeptide (TPR) repeat protein